MNNCQARSEAKAALRRQLRERLKGLPDSEQQEASARVRQRLTEQPVWQSARAILCYLPTAREPNLWPLVLDALAQGRQIVMPRYVSMQGAYEPALVQDIARDLRPGHLRIPEPDAHCPTFPAKQLDLALVPGIGFTLDGGRLGRGQGYFDRLLAEVPGFKCGVAFDCQVIPEIPIEPHDVRLDCLLTPTRWHLCRARS
jgi:5-formyltetrahydrofolate cyclo-ligase